LNLLVPGVPFLDHFFLFPRWWKWLLDLIDATSTAIPIILSPPLHHIFAIHPAIISVCLDAVTSV
jgi:hypothetical protein